MYNVCMQILQSNYKGMVIPGPSPRHPEWSALRCDSDRKYGLSALHPSNYTLHKQLYQLYIYQSPATRYEYWDLITSTQHLSKLYGSLNTFLSAYMCSSLISADTIDHSDSFPVPLVLMVCIPSSSNISSHQVSITLGLSR